MTIRTITFTHRLMRGLLAATLLAAAAGCVATEDDGDYELVIDETGGGKADGDFFTQYVGSPEEFDPGPTAQSGWGDVFADIPNYRTVSRALGAQWLVADPTTGLSKLATVNAELVAAGKDPIPDYQLTGDKFRYHMGPVFYRGRLDGTARVLVVGQDAATDEAVVHRTFVGGTGQKVQGLLDQIGITKSYLFLNTFTYSVFGQFDPFAEALATSGPIADHRSQMFEYAWTSNHIQLIMSFGKGAHTSVQAWLDAYHGGKLPAGVLWVKMLHPGMAAFGHDPMNPDGGDPAIVQQVVDSFGRGWDSVWKKRKSTPGWLPVDADGMKFRKTKFYYANFGIPYRDLPYGAPRELGRGGTATERGDNLRVQIHSANGVRYMAPWIAIPAGATKAKSGYARAADYELSWEPPKLESGSRHDPGPAGDWAHVLAQTPAQEVAAAEAGLTVANDFSRPLWYRGRTDGSATVLVIAQNTTPDAYVAGRVLVGDEGQHINHFLERVGVGLDYVMVSPYPFLSSQLAAGQIDVLSATPSLAAVRQQILRKVLAENHIALVLTFGAGAQAAFAEVASGYTGTWIKMAHPGDTGAYSTWNAGLASIEVARGLANKTFTRYTSSGFANSRVDIPREDLAWGKPLWFGSSGTMSQQADPSWLFWNAPKWVGSEPADGGVPPGAAGAAAGT